MTGPTVDQPRKVVTRLRENAVTGPLTLRLSRAQYLLLRQEARVAGVGGRQSPDAPGPVGAFPDQIVAKMAFWRQSNTRQQ